MLNRHGTKKKCLDKKCVCITKNTGARRLRKTFSKGNVVNCYISCQVSHAFLANFNLRTG